MTAEESRVMCALPTYCLLPGTGMASFRLMPVAVELFVSDGLERVVPDELSTMCSGRGGDGQVTIKLTNNEAWVLSHWLERLQMTDPSRVVEDPAVWAPIHRMPERWTRNCPSCSGPTTISGLRRTGRGAATGIEQQGSRPLAPAVERIPDSDPGR
ncbi:hypothetical protein [Streptomyces atratus]|uniref:hypothetical protein n=1 Tax=Streptomyces atratus TaxID=1893 RepID=UPI0033CD505D